MFPYDISLRYRAEQTIMGCWDKRLFCSSYVHLINVICSVNISEVINLVKCSRLLPACGNRRDSDGSFYDANTWSNASAFVTRTTLSRTRPIFQLFFDPILIGCGLFQLLATGCEKKFYYTSVISGYTRKCDDHRFQPML